LILGKKAAKKHFGSDTQQTFLTRTETLSAEIIKYRRVTTPNK